MSIVTEWKYTECEETYFLTISGKWHNHRKRIWETTDGELFLIDKNNYIKKYIKESKKRKLTDTNNYSENVKKTKNRNAIKKI
jgi:hypothetical protein